MTFKTSTALLSVSFAALTASPSLADITADDIWNSYQAIAETVGGELTATTNRDGNTVVFADAKLHISFPGDEGSVDILYPLLSYTENGDGTLAMDLDGPQTYSFVVTGPNAEADRISADMVITYADAELIATGDPDDITFSYAMDGFEFEVQNLDLGELKDPEDVNFSLTGTGSATKGTSRLSLGDLVTLAGQSEITGIDYSMQIADPSGGISTTNGSYEGMSNSSTITLPTGGMSIMNLAGALHDGLSIMATSKIGGSNSKTVIVADGNEVSSHTSQTMSAGPSTNTISANADAFQLTADGNQIQMAFKYDENVNAGSDNISVTGFSETALEGYVDRATGDFRIPVSKSEEQQDFTFAFGLEGFDLDKNLWALFDPSEILPREPATLLLNLTGKTTLLQNLLNFEEMMQLSDGDVPAQLNELSINDLQISAVGASASATGDFAFDNDDLVSFDGIPAPSGNAEVQISGANGLIDKLIEMGLIAESDAMGARMMMGILTVPGEGEDSLKSNLEITEDGQILANGQRIK
ncbi:DUF2125 domain-containing protein [Parasedimentitalea huanghaiensis]|uniref:DUF2125 domain-containing protein n=1 Tax=Parasedimentitalea huanghaiensis TaxID=2682100 RepID=A0A6L6WG47_9RHOB|nr:DUF2125 domain-containing protein [Zongyanglinia huanghaiensis]MVO16440.1 DUF2125 domain-containing protein [Zongyanglinia huanghaiensis]